MFESEVAGLDLDFLESVKKKLARIKSNPQSTTLRLSYLLSWPSCSSLHRVTALMFFRPSGGGILLDTPHPTTDVLRYIGVGFLVVERAFGNWPDEVC